MILRIVYWLALAAIAWLAASVQIDRQARYAPRHASLAPAWVGGFALEHRTLEALKEEQGERALALARRLVRARPMPAEHLRMLGHAQILVGQEEDGLRTLQVAARRGWRDPAAQAVMLSLAVGAGDTREAASRLIAIWALDPDNPILEAMAPRVIADPQGRATFVRILSASRYWDKAVLRTAPGVLGPPLFAEVLRDLLANGVQFDCATVDRIVASLSGKVDDSLLGALEAGSCTLRN